MDEFLITYVDSMVDFIPSVLSPLSNLTGVWGSRLPITLIQLTHRVNYVLLISLAEHDSWVADRQKWSRLGL